MSAQNKERTSVRLSEADEVELNKLAAKVKCLARAGASFGKPSWRTMLQEMAEGRITVARCDQPTRGKVGKQSKPRNTDEPTPFAPKNIDIPRPDWWDGPQGGMTLEDAMDDSGLSEEALRNMGLMIIDGWIIEPKEWIEDDEEPDASKPDQPLSSDPEFAARLLEIEDEA